MRELTMNAELKPNEPKRLKVGFILARSFTLSAFALFIDTLRLASDESDRSGRKHADWQILASKPTSVISSCGAAVAPTSGLIDPAQFDYIVVVGGLLNAEEPIDKETVAYLRQAAQKKVVLIGACTGSFILAEAGLMKQHLTCVSWLHYETFLERFPDHDVRADRIFNLDRSRGSCAGGSSAADMAAHIVRRHISREAERNAQEVLQIDRLRSGLDIQPRRPLRIKTEDPRLQAALIIMERNIGQTLSIPDLAQSVGLSRRQLERLFNEKAKCTPAFVYRQLRLERAKELLLKTSAPLIEIAIEVGFENASHFAAIFKKAYGQSPTSFRNAGTKSPAAA